MKAKEQFKEFVSLNHIEELEQKYHLGGLNND